MNQEMPVRPKCPDCKMPMRTFTNRWPKTECTVCSLVDGCPALGNANTEFIGWDWIAVHDTYQVVCPHCPEEEGERGCWEHAGLSETQALDPERVAIANSTEDTPATSWWLPDGAPSDADPRWMPW